MSKSDHFRRFVVRRVPTSFRRIQQRARNLFSAPAEHGIDAITTVGKFVNRDRDAALFDFETFPFHGLRASRLSRQILDRPQTLMNTSDPNGIRIR